MDGPLVSVCISTWNRCSDLKKCIDSVLNQDYKNIEIIVVDNASIDKTYDYCKSNDSIQYYRMDNSNYTAMYTLNYAFNKASGKYILVLDDDAYIINNDVISLLVNDLKNDTNAAIVGANVQHIDPYTKELISQMPFRDFNGVFFSQEMIDDLNTCKHYEFHGACALFRNSMVKQVGYYDPDFNIYINEFDLAGKMLNLGYNVLFNSKALVMHVEHSATKCNLKHKYYIRNFNTCITRNFRGVFNRLKTVCIRTPMLYAFWYLRTGHLCRKTTIIYMGIVIGLELIRSIYRSINPDIKHVYPDSFMQSYLESSMYNSFKRYSFGYIMGKK